MKEVSSSILYYFNKITLYCCFLSSELVNSTEPHNQTGNQEASPKIVHILLFYICILGRLRIHWVEVIFSFGSVPVLCSE